MKKNKKNRFLLLFLLLLFLLLGASFVLAQDKGLEVEQYPTVPGAEVPTSVKTPLSDYAKYVLNLLLSLAGLVIFGALVYGGFRYLTASGKPTKLGTAKKQVLAAFLGLVIILSSYLILNTINPQLIVFRTPEWIKIEVLPFVKPLLPIEEQTLNAKEIPIGILIDGTGEYEGVLAKTRLERIEKLSEEIWETTKNIQEISKEISEASQKLETLSQQCVCDNCTATCGGCNACPGICIGDPCGPVRNEIREQQAILSTKPAELSPLKNKLEELKPKLEQEKEELKNALVELEKAEKMMKECPVSFSEQGKTQSLLNLNNFWQYKKGLEGQEIVKKIEIQSAWEDIDGNEDAFTFYCLENPFEVSLLEEGISEENLEEAIANIETSEAEEVKVYCETEIPVGSIIDNAEDIAQRLMDEMKKTAEETPVITAEIPKEITNANSISGLPDCSSCAQWCSCSCAPIMRCCAWSKTGACTAYCCFGCQLNSLCQGTPCPAEKEEIKRINALIQKNHQIINDAFNNITAFDDEIHNLIEGNEVHNSTKKAIPLPNGLRKPTWAYRIINTELPETRIILGDRIRGCLNVAEDWTGALLGEQILGKRILTCEEAKSVCWDIEEDYQCYGEGDPQSYPNYFCGEIKIK